MTECVRCDDCERLYMDQQKCPHWIIIRRKSESGSRQLVLSRQSSVSLADMPRRRRAADRTVGALRASFSETMLASSARLRTAAAHG